MTIGSPGPVRKLWQDHLTGKTNGQYLLWPVLMLMAWLDEWKEIPEREAKHSRSVLSAF